MLLVAYQALRCELGLPCLPQVIQHAPAMHTRAGTRGASCTVDQATCGAWQQHAWHWVLRSSHSSTPSCTNSGFTLAMTSSTTHLNTVPALDRIAIVEDLYDESYACELSKFEQVWELWVFLGQGPATDAVIWMKAPHVMRVAHTHKQPRPRCNVQYAWRSLPASNLQPASNSI